MKKITYIHEHKYLTAKQVEKVFIGAERAFEAGCPLNRFITILYDAYADNKRPQKFIIALMERIRKWLKQRGFPVAYLYVLEKAKYKGIHAHILLHIPTGHQVEFKKAMRRWLPFPMKKPEVKFVSIQYPHYGNLSPLHGVRGTLCYMCKGINPKTLTRGIEPKFQGVLMGRRWGISQLISR